ncbi:MAG: anti-repressor SinI family protein [Tuberibacillus sp.]
MHSSLDKEWVVLMIMARELGLTKEEVREFIERHRKQNDLAEVKP